MTKGRSGIGLSGSRKKYVLLILIAFFMVLLLNSPFILSKDVNINIIKKIRNSNSEHFDPIFVNGNILEFYPKNDNKIEDMSLDNFSFADHDAQIMSINRKPIIYCSQALNQKNIFKKVTVKNCNPTRLLILNAFLRDRFINIFGLRRYDPLLRGTYPSISVQLYSIRNKKFITANWKENLNLPECISKEDIFILLVIGDRIEIVFPFTDQEFQSYGIVFSKVKC